MDVGYTKGGAVEQPLNRVLWGREEHKVALGAPYLHPSDSSSVLAKLGQECLEYSRTSVRDE